MIPDRSLLARAVVLLALASAALAAVAAWIAIGQPAGVPHPSEGVLGAVQMLVFLACAVAASAWLVAAHRQVRANGAALMSVSPAGAVFWYAVPLANLALPAKAMSELRRASLDARNWEAQPGSPVIWIWWSAWLLGGLANTVALRAGLGDTMLADALYPAATLSDLFTLPAALAFAQLVREIEHNLADSRNIGPAFT